MILAECFLPGKNYGIAASLRKPWEKKENKSPAATPDEYLTWAIFARWIFGLRIIHQMNNYYRITITHQENINGQIIYPSRVCNI